MRRAIDLERLEIFLAVAEHRSFTRAAEALYISHSTTSRNVSSLEESLGAKLFLRDGRTVRLTRAGEVLFHEGRQLMRRIKGVEDMVAAAGRERGSAVCVSVSHFSSVDLLSSLHRFCAMRPDVCLSMISTRPRDVFGMVDGGEADIGITAAGLVPDRREDIESLLLPCRGLCLLTSHSDVLAERGGGAELSEIEGRELVCDESTVRLIPSWLAGKNTVTVMPSLESVFMRSGVGRAAAIVPDSMPVPETDGFVKVQLRAPCPESVALLWRGSCGNPALGELLSYIREDLAQEIKKEAFS